MAQFRETAAQFVRRQAGRWLSFRETSGSVFDEIPHGLPALLQAVTLTADVHRGGVVQQPVSTLGCLLGMRLA